MSIDLIEIPKTPADFRPPEPTSEIAEMAALLRNEEHWAAVLPYVMAMAGVAPTIHGSPRYDEAGCTFEVQKICQSNGYTLLAHAPAAKVAKLFKRAYTRNTGQTIKQLLKQGTQLRLEHKRQLEAVERNASAE